MIIHHLKASGFRMMGETIDITFPDEGRIGILGQNESGKTTLFQAIECALYGLKKGSGPEADRENLVTWGKNEAKLEIEFTSGQNRYNLQRAFNSKKIHRANLTPIINGVKDRSSSITGLKDVEDKIEQITGMDRDSFTKLVYIKQKDLDALKELAKAKREQLVNKVMGIELFDDASSKVKEDISELEDELKIMEPKLDMIRKNKEDYESKLNQKSEWEAKIEEQQKKLKEKKKSLENAKSLLTKYDWIFSYNSARDLKCSLEREKDQVEQDLQSISKLKKDATKLEATLKKYKPQVVELQSLHDKLLDIEKQLNQAKDSITELQTQRQVVIDRSGLSAKDLKMLTQNLSQQKNRQLTWFSTTLVTGLACLFIAFLLFIPLLGAGVAILAIAAYFFRQYLKLDKLAAQNIEIEALNKQIQSAEKTTQSLENEQAIITSQTDFKTSEDANTRLKAIFNSLETGTGERSIDGIEAVLRKTNENFNTITRQNPEAKKQNIENHIRLRQVEIEDLEKTKPASIEEIQYTKEQHDSMRLQRESIQAGYDETKQAIDTATGTITQLEDDLKRLKPDFDLFPDLEEQVQTKEEHLKLLKRVNSELAETSKELRNKVIPHARLIINQILPTLTSDRYSDFEITEDLKFKVHSREAGGFKEREIFSGGTQDQFLIALRLAFTQSILDSRVMADKYSLLMDECTSSSDEIRKQGIFEVLEAMKKTFSQIFIIAHEDIANYVDNHLILERNDHGYTEIKSKSWMQ